MIYPSSTLVPIPRLSSLLSHSRASSRSDSSPAGLWRTRLAHCRIISPTSPPFPALRFPNSINRPSNRVRSSSCMTTRSGLREARGPMEVWKKRRRARKRFCEWRGKEELVGEVVVEGDEEGKKRAYPRPRFHPTLCGIWHPCQWVERKIKQKNWRPTVLQP